jgi:glycosyltransferase involved in cell wall biosynthesis
MSSYGFRPKMVTKERTLIYRNREGSMSRTNSTDWVKWFTWSRKFDITPSGAVTKQQLPVLSVDPAVISVIIPVGPGHEKWFMDAVDSVDAQTFRNWECIVINDTGIELQKEMPSWVRLLHTEGKVGPARARNIGIAASKGTLFLPLDADDYLEPQALEMMYDAYRERQAEVIYSDFWQNHIEDITNITRHNCDDYDPNFIKGNSRYFEGEKREGMIHSVTALTPKKRWKQVGGYDENIPGWEDWDFQLALGNVGVCSRRVAYPLFTYRMHTGLRREENFGFFERSKEGIIKKWGALWEGGKEMACGACRKGAGTTYYPSTTAMRMGGGAGNDPGGAKLVHYRGSKAAAISYRGKSGTTYWFSSTDPDKYVLEQDMVIFSTHTDFEIIQPVIKTEEPELVAEGAPVW